MHGSQYIRQISIKLKQYLKQCEESGNFAPTAAKKTVLDCLVPLSEIVLKSPTSSHAALPSDVIPVESPYIYALIAEYLCSQNAVDSARILLEEIDEMLPVKSTHETVCIPTVYLPWAEELHAVVPRLVTKKSLSYTQMADIKKKCQRIINSHKEAEAPTDPVTKLYSIIESALKEMDNWNNWTEQRKDVFQHAIVKIKKCFFEENETLVYFDGHIGHVYSKYTAQYEEIKRVLGLFVIPTRHNEVKQLVHAKRACSPKSGITLETFYHIGKKMEEINITPYDTEVEVESAVPPILSFHSTFFCPVLRSECSFDNMPCVLTCGHIISVKAVEKIASFKGVIFKCPYCPKDVNVKDVFKIKMTI